MSVLKAFTEPVTQPNGQGSSAFLEQPTQQSPEREEGTGESLLIGLGSGINRVLQEGQKVGMGFLEKNFLVEQGSTEALSNDINNEREFFNKTPVGDSTAGKIGQFTGEVLPTLVVPGGVTGGVLRRMVAGAGAGAISGAMAPTDESDLANEDRVINTIAGTAFGAVLPGLFQGGKFVTNKVHEFTKGFKPSSALDDIAQSVTRSDVRASLESARRLNTFMTPAETTGFGELVVREGSIRLDDPALRKLGTSIRNREGTLKKSIVELVEEIAPDTPERAKLISEGYEALNRTAMRPKLLEGIQNDRVLGKQYKKFLKATGFSEAIAEIPENSFSRLDHFNEFLRERATSFFNSGKTRAGRQITEKRKELLNFLDTTVPEYGIARREAQLNIIKKQMNKGMAKIKGTGFVDDSGVPVPDAVQFYQKFLKSGEAYEDLVMNLTDHPGALQKISDLRTVLSSIESSPLKKLFRAAPEPTEGIRTVGLREAGLALTETLRINKSRYSSAMLDLITDPKWDSKILENAAALAKKDATTASRVKAAEEFTMVLAKVLGKESASRDSNVTETTQ